MIPYARIIEEANRRWTPQLLARLTTPGLGEEELDQLRDALTAVADPRTVAPLEAVVGSAADPDDVRRVASYALRMSELSYEPPEEVVRRWWHEGDEMLRRHALLSMEAFCCPDIVRQIARDPAHPLQARALGLMQFRFDRRDDQAIKIAALGHPDPEMRELAAWVLFWVEPVYAEDALLDATHDPVVAVAAEAANTLEYYPTKRVLRRMHELLEHPDEKVREAADDSFESLRGTCLYHLRSSDPR